MDVDPATLNISIPDLESKISERTKAIVCVYYGGLPCDMKQIGTLAARYGIPVIEDAAHAVGASYGGVPVGAISEFTMYSFQAIKHLTTGDGGMGRSRTQPGGEGQAAAMVRIDRTLKQKGIWETTSPKSATSTNSPTSAPRSARRARVRRYAGHRRALYRRYVDNLRGVNHVKIVDDFDPLKAHAAWLFTILVDRREDCQLKLRSRRIESGQTHYRNDRYSVFHCAEDFPRMDTIDDNYLIGLSSHVPGVPDLRRSRLVI